jgi:pyruvate/2-oxoglutarate dehydrogenase complex dihydrolipoamide acyltransferase (E2) component
VLESIAKGEGETVNVGDVIGTIGEVDGRPAKETEEVVAEAPEEEERAEAEQPEAEAEEEPDGHCEMEGVRASPSVRKLAQEYEIDLAEVSGSGSGGA